MCPKYENIRNTYLNMLERYNIQNNQIVPLLFGFQDEAVVRKIGLFLHHAFKLHNDENVNIQLFK